MQASTELPAFVNAVIRLSKVVEESTVIGATASADRARNVETKTETNSEFSIGVEKPSAPDSFQVQVSYRVVLSNAKDSAVYLTYTSRWVAVFKVLSVSAELNWTDAPPEVFAPYFSFLHLLVRERAQASMDIAGARGPGLPVPDNISGEIAGAATNA